MRNKFLNIAFASVLFVVTSVANAGIITLNNSTEIEVLSLNESFTAFYNYGNASSNTNFEQEATAVMFLAESNGELALITLLDAAKSASGASHGKRYADLAISDFNPANVLLVDDSNESNINGFSWAWFACCTDGMVYQIEDTDNFDIDLTFSNVTGLTDFKFLSFGTELLEINVQQSLSIQSGSVTTVPEPTTLAIFALAMFGLVSRRIKR
jgi:hypothetical protein